MPKPSRQALQLHGTGLSISKLSFMALAYHFLIARVCCPDQIVHVAGHSRQCRAETIAAADPCSAMCRQEEDEEDEDSDDDEEYSETQIWIRSIGKLAAGKLAASVFLRSLTLWALHPDHRTLHCPIAQRLQRNAYVLADLSLEKRCWHSIVLPMCTFQDVSSNKLLQPVLVLSSPAGVAICAIFSDPLVDALNSLSKALNIAPFFVAFALAPLASNASEMVSSLSFAAGKTRRNISLTFSQASLPTAPVCGDV